MDSKHTLADWLLRHDLTADLCLDLLDRLTIPEGPGAVTAAYPVEDDPTELWRDCGAVLCRHVPGLGDAVGLVLNEARVDFADPPFRYPTAFTLHDDGQGRPYVHIPWEGQVGDVLALAHEFGHAVQIVASAGREMTPVLREACAFLVEGWVCDALSDRNDPWGRVLLQLEKHRVFLTMTKEAAILHDALTEPGRVYDYIWNYPVAQAVVSGRLAGLNAYDLLALFEGRLGLTECFSEKNS